MVAQNPYGEDHAWIYMGEFNSRNEVVSYLKSIGVSESLINSKQSVTEKVQAAGIGESRLTALRELLSITRPTVKLRLS